MSSERNLSAVAPILLTADGGAEGQVVLTTTLNLFVKQKVVLQAPLLPPLNVEIKWVVSETKIIVGPIGNPNMAGTTNVSAYTVAAGSFLFATAQPKAKICMEDRLYGSYIQEPINAWRVQPVDGFGEAWDSTNPLPVSFEGELTVTNVGIIGPNPDKNQLVVNADGSINVNVETSPSPNSTVVSTYNEIVSLAAGGTSIITSYTIPVGKQGVLQKAPFSGENIGRYDLLINSVKQDTARTMFGGDLTGEFNFTSGNESGLLLNAGDVIAVQVYNPRPYPADFESRIQVLVIT